MSRNAPLMAEENGVYLARIVNQAADSFDVAALSNEEAIVVYMLLDRITDALWSEHKRVLLPLYQGLIKDLEEPEEDDDDSEGPGSDSH